MDWKAIRLLGAPDQFYMNKEDFDQKGNLISKQSPYTFLDENLYEVTKKVDSKKIQVKKTTAKINMSFIFAIEDSEYDVEVTE